MVVSDQGIQRVDFSFLEVPRQRFGGDVWRREDELTNQLGILQRRRLQQSRQTRKEVSFPMVGDGNLHEHFAGWLALEDGSYRFEAGKRVRAIALRDRVVWCCAQRQALNPRQQRLQSFAADLELAQDHVVFGVFDVARLDAAGLPDRRQQQRATARALIAQPDRLDSLQGVLLRQLAVGQVSVNLP